MVKTKIIHTLGEFFSATKIKALLAGLCTFLANSIGDGNMVLVEVIAYLIIIDWIMGVSVSIKKRRFSSFHLSQSLWKALFYMLLLIATFQATRSIFMPEWFDDFVGMFIIVTELKSIFENSAILGFKPARFIEDKINEILESKLNKNINA